MRHFPALTRIPALATLVFFGGCGGDAPRDTAADPSPEARSGEAAADDPREAALDGLQLILAIDRLAYGPGDTIQMELVVVNRLDEPRTLRFPTAQRVDARILDAAGEERLRWSETQVFAQVMGEETLEPGDEGRRWTLELVAPDEIGSYRLVGLLVANEGPLEAILPLEVR